MTFFKDITPNVLEHSILTVEKERSFIKKHTPKFMNYLMSVFAGVKGTLVYKKVSRRRVSLFSLHTFKEETAHFIIFYFFGPKE